MSCSISGSKNIQSRLRLHCHHPCLLTVMSPRLVQSLPNPSLLYLSFDSLPSTMEPDRSWKIHEIISFPALVFFLALRIKSPLLVMASSGSCFCLPPWLSLRWSPPHSSCWGHAGLLCVLGLIKVCLTSGPRPAHSHSSVWDTHVAGSIIQQVSSNDPFSDHGIRCPRSSSFLVTFVYCCPLPPPSFSPSPSPSHPLPASSSPPLQPSPSVPPTARPSVHY